MTTRNVTAVRKTYGAGALVALAVLFIGVTILITFVLRGARIDPGQQQVARRQQADGHQPYGVADPADPFRLPVRQRPAGRPHDLQRAGDPRGIGGGEAGGGGGVLGRQQTMRVGDR